MFFPHRFLHWFFITFLMKKRPKMVPANYPVRSLLATFWRPFPNIDFYVDLCWFMLILAAIWHPFGSTWLPFGSPWLPFGSLWLPFCSLWLHFGTLRAPFLTFGSIVASFLHFSCFFAQSLLPPSILGEFSNKIYFLANPSAKHRGLPHAPTTKRNFPKAFRLPRARSGTLPKAI